MLGKHHTEESKQKMRETCQRTYREKGVTGVSTRIRPDIKDKKAYIEKFIPSTLMCYITGKYAKQHLKPEKWINSNLRYCTKDFKDYGVTPEYIRGVIANLKKKNALTQEELARLESLDKEISMPDWLDKYQCAVCRHPQIAEINELISNPLVNLGDPNNRFGFNRNLLYRHRIRCLGIKPTNRTYKNNRTALANSLKPIGLFWRMVEREIKQAYKAKMHLEHNQEVLRQIERLKVEQPDFDYFITPPVPDFIQVPKDVEIVAWEIEVSNKGTTRRKVEWYKKSKYPFKKVTIVNMQTEQTTTVNIAKT